MNTPKTLPHSGPQFEAMIREIDAALVAEGHPIENRPLLAAFAMERRLAVSTTRWPRTTPRLTWSIASATRAPSLCSAWADGRQSSRT